ncbi:uncharacterized protein LOC124419138 [Lucilia cuprina]|uniref:uncharacterized protein LOC124419138 n=1 Tax=Lucilia cuprina TaxID=7375 RepID=UPI001F06EB3B|nr:uncharacterized protein LOC124419138 [Lucilia cuprina]
MKFYIVFISLALIVCQIKADIIDNSAEEELISNELSALEDCEERICGRIYSPICISIDNEKFNVASMCHLSNLRCELMKYTKKSSNAEKPVFRVLHFGQCEDQEEN